MGEVITLMPNEQYTLVVDRSKDGYYARWTVSGETMWQFETTSLDELKVFASNMLGRIDVTFPPLSGA